jgi:hypothetical protein
MGIDIAVVLVISLVLFLLGSEQFSIWLSNLFFASTFIFLIVAVIPMFGDIGDSRKALRRMKKEGKIVSREGTMDLDQERRRTRMTYSYGLAAVVSFFLAFFSLAAG